jgi:hypothetical protein
MLDDDYVDIGFFVACIVDLELQNETKDKKIVFLSNKIEGLESEITSHDRIVANKDRDIQKAQAETKFYLDESEKYKSLFHKSKLDIDSQVKSRIEDVAKIEQAKQPQMKKKGSY